jgi:hypothetical protein
MSVLLEAVTPGQTVEVVFERRGRRMSRTIRPQADPHTLVVPADAAAGAVSGRTRRFRDAWLSSQADRLLKSREP